MARPAAPFEVSVNWGGQAMTLHDTPTLKGCSDKKQVILFKRVGVCSLGTELSPPREVSTGCNPGV